MKSSAYITAVIFSLALISSHNVVAKSKLPVIAESVPGGETSMAQDVNRGLNETSTDAEGAGESNTNVTSAPSPTENTTAAPSPSPITGYTTPSPSLAPTPRAGAPSQTSLRPTRDSTTPSSTGGESQDTKKESVGKKKGSGLLVFLAILGTVAFGYMQFVRYRRRQRLRRDAYIYSDSTDGQLKSTNGYLSEFQYDEGNEII